jgi:predicted lactoylglutathione lyase
VKRVKGRTCVSCLKINYMKPQKIWANFSVKDARRTREFYTQLGFIPSMFNNDPKLASFVFGENDFVIHFFEQGTQIDEYLTPGSQSGSEIIFTLSAESEAEVKEWADRLNKSGGKLLKEPVRDESGYYGFAFADPDGHKFNVLLMDKM